jgi:hypothetical protein
LAQFLNFDHFSFEEKVVLYYNRLTCK